MGAHEWEPVLAPMSNRRWNYWTCSNLSEGRSAHYDAVVGFGFSSLSSRRGNGPAAHRIAANPWPLTNMAVNCH